MSTLVQDVSAKGYQYYDWNGSVGDGSKISTADEITTAEGFADIKNVIMNMLRIEHLTKSYGAKKAVDDLSLRIAPGELYAFIGHNGAGKTTTIKSCCGILNFEKGDIFIDGISIRKNPLACKQIMNTLPFIYRNLGNWENRIIYYESSRGCPFSCAYCLSSIEKDLRFRDLSLTLSELSFFLEAGTAQVKFTDRTFNCRPDRVKAIWRHLLEKDNGVTNFHFEIAADLFDEEELEILEKARPGLIQLEIGVQSTNPETLAAIHRKADFGKIRDVVNRIRSFGNTNQHLDLIAGLPYEGYESFQNSFNDVYALRPEQLQLGFLKVLKGSDMALQAP